jgi:hypothetical protein
MLVIFRQTILMIANNKKKATAIIREISLKLIKFLC